jgi:hypothetical protein
VTRSKRGRSPEEWGAIVADLFNNSLATFLLSATVSSLGKTEVVDLLYRDLRPFMTLKTKLEADQPSHELLRQPNSALLHFANRLFTTTHQALLNSIEAEDEEKRLKGEPLKRLRTQTEPTRELLLEWQMLRLKEARTQFFVTLAELSNLDRGVLESANLPDELKAQVEAAQK